MTMDKTRITGQDLGRALCTALDLDPSNITSITITAAVGEVPTVTTTRITAWEHDGVTEALRAYRLVPAQLHPDQVAGG